MIEKGKLVKIVGASNVTSEQAVLDDYAKDMSFVNTIKPDYVVKPRNTDDVQKIVKLARETLTPLVPVSSGPPTFAAIPSPAPAGLLSSI